MDGVDASTTRTGEPQRRLRSLDVCSGGGGLALGLEQAGFDPVMLIDHRAVACETLRLNRPGWDVLETDLLEFDPVDHQQVYDVDLLSAGLPRVQASAAVHRTRGSAEELKLLRATILLMHGVRPAALLVENVSELVTKDVYRPTRDYVDRELRHLGYSHQWFVVNALDYGVPQDRKQGVLVAFRDEPADKFEIPSAAPNPLLNVAEALADSLSVRGWDPTTWAAQADRVAPTLVGGSWERGGPDLGPTGSKQIWAQMGVDGATLADEVPDAAFQWNPNAGRPGMVQFTTVQAALLQGFPPDWVFCGGKTARYRQIGNASPPPVGKALGVAIRAALRN